MHPPRSSEPPWRALALVRYHIRCFLAFSERAAHGTGLSPQQHQLLLAIRGVEKGAVVTIGYLAEHLLLRHHSAVGLVDRLARRGLVRRGDHPDDRRCVTVALTPRGEALLGRLTRMHLEEIGSAGPALLRALEDVLRTAGRDGAPLPGARAPRR